MIGNNGGTDARARHYTGRPGREVDQLRLGAVAEKRSAEHIRAAFLQLLRHHMPLRRVNQHIFQSEFLRDADACKNIIPAVRVNMHRKLSADYGKKRFTFRVKVGKVIILALPRLFNVLGITPRFGKRFAYDLGGGHTGHRGFVAVVMDVLGVFAQCHLHGNRRLDHGFIDPAADRLDGGHRSSDGIGAARPCHHRGHSRTACLLKAAVKAVDRIDGSQRRGGRHAHLVAVLPFKAHAVLPHSQVGVRVNEARIDSPAPEVYHRLSLVRLIILHTTYAGYSSSVHTEIPV